MTPKDKRRYKAWIKERYPVGTEIWDDTRSGPFTVRKDSIFEVFEDDPASGIHEYVTFTVRHPGKYSDRFQVKTVPIRWIIKTDETETMKVLVTIKTTYKSIERRQKLVEEIKDTFSGMGLFIQGASFTTKSVEIIKLRKNQVEPLY